MQQQGVVHGCLPASRLATECVIPAWRAPVERGVFHIQTVDFLDIVSGGADSRWKMPGDELYAINTARRCIVEPGGKMS